MHIGSVRIGVDGQARSVHGCKANGHAFLAKSREKRGGRGKREL